MKIIKIQIQDYLGISTLKAEYDKNLGKINLIEGGNGVGKSAVLKAVKEAFKSSGVDPQIIRKGKDKSEILLELDSGILINRNITPGTNTVKVVIDGAPISRPQKFLKSLIGEFNFDPTEFYLAKPKERRQILLSAMPFELKPDSLKEYLPEEYIELVPWEQINFQGHGLEVLDRIKGNIYDRRHECNIGVTRLRKAIEQDKEDLPPNIETDRKRYANFDFDKRMDDYESAQSLLSNHENNLKRINELRTMGENKAGEISRIERRIEELKQELKKARNDLDDINAQGVQMKQKIDDFVAPPIEDIKAEIRGFKDFQKLLNKLEEIDKRQADLEGEAEQHAALDRLHKFLDTDVSRRVLEEVKFPIPGIEIQGDDILVDDVSIDKMSTSEQLKFAIAVAKQLAGKLRVICVDRFESLDDESRRAFIEEAEKDEFEYFMTVVNNGDLRISQMGQSDHGDKSTETKQVSTNSNKAVNF